MGSSNFRGLEATNRRETAVLVVAFMLLFGALGLGLDFAARDFAIVDGHLVGFPVLTIAALVFAAVQSIVSFYSGASLVLLSVHARPLTPDTPKHRDGARCDQRNGGRGANAGAQGLCDGRSLAKRFCDRPRSGPFGDLRHPGTDRRDGPRGVAGCDRARNVARSRLRHPHNDDDRGAGGRDRDAVGFPLPLDVLGRLRLSAAGGSRDSGDNQAGA